MPNKKGLLLCFLLISAVTLSGCSFTLTPQGDSSSPQAAGAVYKSGDQGLSWEVKSNFPGIGKSKLNIKKISLDYFGWADPSYYLGDKAVWVRNGKYTSAGEFLRDNPGGGYIAVSATFYQQSLATDKNYGWLSEYQPVIVVGNSIFVWHITQ